MYVQECIINAKRDISLSVYYTDALLVCIKHISVNIYEFHDQFQEYYVEETYGIIYD